MVSKTKAKLLVAGATLAIALSAGLSTYAAGMTYLAADIEPPDSCLPYAALPGKTCPLTHQFALAQGLALCACQQDISSEDSDAVLIPASIWMVETVEP